MYPVSDIYAKKIGADNRTFAVEIELESSHGNPLTGTTIQNITLDELVNSTDTLTMGCACSNKITVNLINPPRNIAYDGVSFKAKVGLLVNDRPKTYQWIPLGTFYGTEAETSNDFKNLKLTAYDGFFNMTGKYNARVDEKTTLQAVYDDLRTKLGKNCGVVLNERILPQYTIEKFPYLDITYTQAIGYVAGCLGGFARFDRNGDLEIANYTDSTTKILRDMQYMNGFKRTTKEPLIITSLSTGTNDNPIIRGDGGNGTNIFFENPYITSEMADDIWESVKNKSYTPCQVKWRGDPAVQAGDIVSAIDKDDEIHTVLVMSQTLKIGGGCNSTIECKGTNTTKTEFSSNFESVGKKIERTYNTLEKAIIDATNAITGNSGGYVELLDTNDDGKPDEIVIMDTPDRETAKNVWRWNKAGLGFSSKGYQGPYTTAITSDGKIVADFIRAGTIQAEIFKTSLSNAGKYLEIKDEALLIKDDTNVELVRLDDKGLTVNDGKIVIKDHNGNEAVFFDGTGDVILTGCLSSPGTPAKAYVGKMKHGNQELPCFAVKQSGGFENDSGTIIPMFEVGAAEGDSDLRGVRMRVRNGIVFDVNDLDFTDSDNGSGNTIARLVLSETRFCISVNGEYVIDYFDFSKCGTLYGTWTSLSSLGTASDLNKKNSIESLSDQYTILFDGLKPIRYKYNDGTSSRYHTGFIAQDVEQAIIDAGLDTGEFAGYIKDKDGNHFLRYEEFIALAVKEIQTLKANNTKLENRVSELEKKIDLLISAAE